MQSEVKNYGQGFILIDGNQLDLYDWLNDQNYGYLDGLNVYKYLLVSIDELMKNWKLLANSK